MSGLALAVGVGVVNALQVAGVTDARLKWPNDVLWQQRKVAGILLEMTGEAGGAYHVVVGVGLNVNMCPQPCNDIDQPWADIATAVDGGLSRNRVAGLLLDSLLKTLSKYQKEGFNAFSDKWHCLDAFAGEEVTLHMPSGTVCGLARGVDQSGALLLETGDGIQSYHSGEVSLRPV